MLADRMEGNKKLSIGHQKQIERMAQNGTDAMKMPLLEALENRLNAAKDTDPGMKALKIQANQNKINLHNPEHLPHQRSNPQGEPNR